MAESPWQDAVGNEELIIHRGLALLGGMLAGAGMILRLGTSWVGSVPDADGIVGFLSLGLRQPHMGLHMVLIILGAVAGMVLSDRLWVWLAQAQRGLGSLPQTMVLKRAALPFAVFLPQMTQWVSPPPQIVLPLVSFAGLVIGLSVLAWLERGDKRKIYFAHPTEHDYHPASLFTHGSVLVLGAGAGWFLQSLAKTPEWVQGGLWVPVLSGIGVWIAALLLAGVLNLIFAKPTFDQVFLAVAVALLPMALLPLQTFGGYQYLASSGQVLGGKNVPWLPAALVGGVGISSLVIFMMSLWRLRHQSVQVLPSWEELFRALMLIAAIPVLILAVAYWPAGAVFGSVHLAGPLDAFQEGESLGIAQGVLSGRLPFKEMFLRHGFAPDVLTGLAAIQWLGPSLESQRLLLTLLMPLGVVAIYYLAIFCLPWMWALALIMLVVTGQLGTIAVTRFFFTLVGFIFTLYYIQRNRWPILLFSGVLTALAVISSYVAGIMALTGHLLLLLAVGITQAGERKSRLLGLGVYLGSALLAMLPWFLYLAMSGSLSAYFQNFYWVLTHYTAVLGRPLPGLSGTPSLGTMILFAFPLLTIVGGTLYFLFALRHPRDNGPLPWNVLLLSALTLLFWMRYVQRGDWEFFKQTLPIAGMLAAFFVYRLTAARRHLRGLVLLVLLPPLFLPQAGKTDLTHLLGGFGVKNQVPVGTWTMPRHPNLAGSYIEPAQAEDLDALTTYLDQQVGSAEAFFDFSNQPLLYFLVPRPQVVQSVSSVALASLPQQLEAISHLAHADVKAVVCDGRPAEQTGWDGIPFELRHYALSEYLLSAFVPTKKIGSAVVLSPRDTAVFQDEQALAAIRRNVHGYGLPLTLGKESQYDPAHGGSLARFLPEPDALRALSAQGVTVNAQGEILDIGSFAQPLPMTFGRQGGGTERGNALVFDLKVSPRWDKHTAVLAWGDEKAGEQMFFTLAGDDQIHRYVFRVGALAAWHFAAPVQRLRMLMPGGNWAMGNITMMLIRDIPELTRLPKADPQADPKAKPKTP